MTPRRRSSIMQQEPGLLAPSSLNTTHENGIEEESPLDQVISFLTTTPSPPPPPPSSSKQGVSVPPILQELFDIDFLPRFDDEEEEKKNTGDKDVPLVQEDATESIASDLSLDDDDENKESAPTETKKKRRSVAGGIASRMRQAKAKRKQRKRLGSSGEVSADNKEKSSVNTAWIQKQQAKLQQHKATLESVQEETKEVTTRAKNLQVSIASIQQEVKDLEQALANSVQNLEQDTKLLQQSKKKLKKLETKRNKAASAVQETSAAIRAAGRPPRLARKTSVDDDFLLTTSRSSPKSGNSLCSSSAQSAPPVRPRADSAPTVLRRAASSSFIRIHDLDLEGSSLSEEGSSSFNKEEAKDIFFLDDNVPTVLNALAKSGYELATDESDRFVPALQTEKLLSQYTTSTSNYDSSSWPVQPWQAPQGDDVLVWTGSVDHQGHGCGLPVFKARALIPTNPRNVLDLLMDSSRAMEYNKMSQGRTDVLVLQAGIDTTAAESAFGVAGEAKIIRSLNKPPLIRKSIEMVSLIYARPLEHADGYMAVNRSVWEDSSATPKPSKDLVRSEILMGGNIFRAVPGPTNAEVYCELTTITHAHTSLVPEGIARKMGPTQAITFIRDVRDLFSKQQR